jgi:hypothetical protein
MFIYINYIRIMNLGFHKMRGISWLAENLLASQEGFCSIVQVNVMQSRDRSGVAQRVPEGLGSQISWHLAREGCEVVSLTHRPPLPPRMLLVLIFTRGWVDPPAMVRSEGNMSLKNPVTPPGIDPETVRLEAQRLNHYTTPGVSK